MDFVSKRIRCADGFTMSVQASSYHCASPRVSGLGFYNEYEVGFPSEAEPLLIPYAEYSTTPTETVYGYVPAQVIVDVITKHGGIVGTDEENANHG